MGSTGVRRKNIYKYSFIYQNYLYRINIFGDFDGYKKGISKFI